MATKRKTKTKAAATSQLRQRVLGIRITQRELDLLHRAAKRFPDLSQSAVARIALLRGLELILRDGIVLAPS